MKNFIISLMTLLACSLSGNAQEIFNEIMKKSQATAADPTANETVRRIAQFKTDALGYMLLKMREEMPDSSVILLDRQALALNTFVTFYINSVLEASTMPDAYQIEVIKRFMDASFSNSLFNDEEQDITLSYYARSDCFTRFSLDTDWPRANVAAMMALNTLKREKGTATED